MRLASNFLYLSGAEAISKIVTFAAIAYIARVAGPVAYGNMEFAASVLLCASLIVDLGLGFYGAREIAKTPAHTAALVWDVVSSRVVLALIAYGAVIALAVWLNRSPIVTQLLVIYGLSLLANPFLLQWVFQGHDMMRTVALIQLLRQVAYAVIVFAVVRGAAQIWGAAAAEVAAVCAAGAFSLWAYRRQLGGALQVRLAIPWEVLRQGVAIGLSQIFWTMRMFGATVVVGLIAAPEDTAYFGAAMRILVAVHTFIWLYYFNLFPAMTQAWQVGAGRLNEIVSRSARAVAWLGLPAAALWVAAAPPAVTAIYGAAFAPAGAALQWLAGAALAAAMSGHYRYALIAAGRQTSEMVISGLGAAAALALIPAGYRALGTNGAALAVVAAEAIVLGVAWWCVRARLGLGGQAPAMSGGQ